MFFSWVISGDARYLRRRTRRVCFGTFLPFDIVSYRDFLMNDAAFEGAVVHDLAAENLQIWDVNDLVLDRADPREHDIDGEDGAVGSASDLDSIFRSVGTPAPRNKKASHQQGSYDRRNQRHVRNDETPRKGIGMESSITTTLDCVLRKATVMLLLPSIERSLLEGSCYG